TEIGFHDRDNARDGISRARMGQLAGVYLCWVIKRISCEYSQLLPSKDGEPSGVSWKVTLFPLDPALNQITFLLRLV
ncbi:MAG: hypothetical protein ACTHY5_10285, partial [Oceanisphaera sp.]|uniref:hypothetical protein n=1 Tax=Oceanisphaera sp. TaxID=1929979 RepID=UPI003F9E88C0